MFSQNDTIWKSTKNIHYRKIGRIKILTVIPGVIEGVLPRDIFKKRLLIVNLHKILNMKNFLNCEFYTSRDVTDELIFHENYSISIVLNL